MNQYTMSNSKQKGQRKPSYYLKEKAEANPLVISDISSLLRIYSFVYAWMSNINTNPLPESTGDGVGGMDPAVCVQHILWDVFRVNTVYGVTNILASGCHYREGKEKCDCGRIMKPEDAGVYHHMLGLHEPLQPTEHVQHGQAGSFTPHFSQLAPNMETPKCFHIFLFVFTFFIYS